MKTLVSKKEAKQKIDEFFSRDDFNAKDVKKIKRLAMKFKIKLGVQRKKFCKKCFCYLRGKIRVNKNYRIIECSNCGFKNKAKLIKLS